MVMVKFESIYTETDRYGNTRRLENRFEASGEVDEVTKIIGTIMIADKLPGSTPIGSLNSINKYLIGYNDDD